MAQMRPVRPPDPPKETPQEPKRWKGYPIETDVAPAPLTVDKKHSVQYIGSIYYCICGHDYGRPPMETILEGAEAVEKWLNPLINEHEKQASE
jgi:hypothetical protein